MNLYTVRLMSLVSDLMVPVYMRETRHESTHYITINSIPWGLTNEHLLDRGIVIWPARAKSMIYAIGVTGSPREATDRILKYIETMSPQVEQLSVPHDKPEATPK